MRVRSASQKDGGAQSLPTAANTHTWLREKPKYINISNMVEGIFWRTHEVVSTDVCRRVTYKRVISHVSDSGCKR